MENQLVDLRIGYPDRNTFPTLQVFECDICGSLTNIVYGPHKYLPRVHAVCPSADEKWHYTIREKMEWLAERPHPKTYARELRKEINKLKREAVKKAVNRLFGNPDLSQRLAVVKTGGSLRISSNPASFRLR